jgi:uncharacterized protein with HEPN domain
MAGMRDKLIHAYFGIDYEVIYNTVKDRIPNIKSMIERMLEWHNR